MLKTAKKLTRIKHPLNGEMKKLLHPFKGVLKFSFAFKSSEQSSVGILLDYLNMLFMLPFIAYHFSFNQVKRYEMAIDGGFRSSVCCDELSRAFTVLRRASIH